jgi:flagellar FliJ protein
MQNILDIKKKMEIQAKNEYAIANRNLDEEKEKLNALLGRRRYYEDKVREHLTQEKLDLKEVMEAKVAIRSIEEQMRRQYERVRRAELILEEKRTEMTELMTERKTHEKLKEQAFEAFMQEERKAEIKQIDELTSYVYGVGKDE